MKYVLRENYRAPNGVDAKCVATELETIRAKYDKLKPEIVVQESRSTHAPLHPCFEWNDEAAAEHYRVWQARHLIRAVRVVYEDDTDKPTKKTPVFVHVNPEGKANTGYYQSTEIAVKNQDEWASAVSHLASKVTSAEGALSELRQVAMKRGDDTAGLITIAAQALATARDAVNQMRH